MQKLLLDPSRSYSRIEMLRALAGVVRAPFLLLPIVLVAVGAAASESAVSWPRTAVALVGLVGLHVAVNAWNEVADFRSGIDLATSRTPFSGGSGTLPAGALAPRTASAVGYAGAFVGLTAGFWLLAVVGWRLLPLLVVGAVAVVAYTGILARSYLGEVFAGLGLGALPVVGTAMAQGGELGTTAVVAAIPAFCMTFNLLFLNEFPDEEADRAGGRRNLITLLGRRRAALLYAGVALAVPAVLLGAVAASWLPVGAAAAAVPSALLAGPLAWALRRPETEVPVAALAANVAWNLGTNALLALALMAQRPAS